MREWRLGARACKTGGEGWDWTIWARSLNGDAVLPGDEAWDASRQAWNLAVDQRPVAVVYPESADDVVATVRLRRGARAPHRVQRRRPQRRPDRLGRGHAPPEDRADARHRDRCGARRARVEAGRAVEAAGRRGRRARPRLPRRARRRTSACSAMRSAVASAGWSAGSGSPATASSRPRWSPPTAGSSGPTATPSPSCSGRSVAAAATSPP